MGSGFRRNDSSLSPLGEIPYRSTTAAIASSLRTRSLRSATSIISPAGLRGSPRRPPASSSRRISSQPCQPRNVAKVAMPRPARAAPATVSVVIGSFISFLPPMKLMSVLAKRFDLAGEAAVGAGHERVDLPHPAPVRLQPLVQRVLVAAFRRHADRGPAAAWLADDRENPVDDD